jgi:alpha-mannosidase
VVLLALAGLISLAHTASPQTAFFADGYHGGVYGHYPDRTTRFIVDTLEQHPRWRINLEIEPETWDRAKEKDREAYDRFKALFAEQTSRGRIEYVNPAYGQSYLWNISGESVIRQFLYGMRKVREHFPETVFSTYSSEEPCFTSALPGILKSLGFTNAVLKNPDTCWGGYTRAFGGELVNWIGPDGTKLVTVPRYAIEALKPRSTWQTIAWNNSAEYLSAARQAGIAHPVGMCLQDAGWENGPWLGDNPDASRPTEYVTWRNYFENVATGTPTQDWRFSQEDVLVSLVWGSQVLQRIARQVRSAENELLRAEKLAALAAVYRGTAWPAAELEEAWRTLLLAQHHDCWIVPYNGGAGNTWADKVERWTGTARTNSEVVLSRAAASLSQAAGTEGQLYVRVFNTTGTRRRDVASVVLPGGWGAEEPRVLDASGRELPSQVVKRPDSDMQELLFKAQVPAMGYTTCQVQRKKPSRFTGASARLLKDGTCELATDLYHILLDPAKGGTVRSLVVKSLPSAERELVDGANARRFNEFRGNFCEAGGFLSSADAPAAFRILESGPVRACLEIKGRIGPHTFTELISVAQGQARIDFDLRLEWKENPGIGSGYGQTERWRSEEPKRAFYDDREKLLALFPLKLKSSRIYKNAPYDVTRSELADTFFNTWDGIKNNVILDWVDAIDADGSRGVALLSDHTTSYTHGPDFPLGLTLQYSGIGLWGRRYSLRGPSSIRYALVPHAASWDKAAIWSEDARWNEPLLAVNMATKPAANDLEKSLLDVTGTGWEVPAMFLEKGNVFVRLFNAQGDETPQRIRFGGRAETVELVELDGRSISRPAVSTDASGRRVINLAIPRFGIRTLRFEHTRP